MSPRKPPGFDNFDSLMRKLVKVPAEALMTEAQKLLKAKSGTPEEFANACHRAAETMWITWPECHAAIQKYNREWAEAAEKK